MKTESSLNNDDIDAEGKNVIQNKAYRHFFFEKHLYLDKYN